MYLIRTKVVQRLKCLPAMWDTRVRSLVREDPLEKEMAAHSSILVWRIPWREDLVGYNPWGCKELDTTSLHFTSFLTIGDSGHPEGRAVAELSLWQAPENNCEISE